MGVAPRRVLGLIYAVIGGFLTIGFIAVVFRQPRDMSEDTRRHVAVKWFAPVVFAMILALLIILVNLPIWTTQYYCLKMIDHQQVTKECIELLRTTQFTNKIQRITYLPQKNRSSLPSGLRKLNLELINVEKQSIVLQKSRAARLVYIPSKTNPGAWDLMFYGYAPLYKIKKKMLTVEP